MLSRKRLPMKRAVALGAAVLMAGAVAAASPASAGCNPCNPCAVKSGNPCAGKNPCAAKSGNPCAAE